MMSSASPFFKGFLSFFLSTLPARCIIKFDLSGGQGLRSSVISICWLYLSLSADSSRPVMRKGFAGSLRTLSCARNQRLQTASSQSPENNDEGSTDDSGNSDASDRSTIGSLDAILGIEGDIEDNNNVAQEQEQESQVSWVEAPLKRASAGPMLPGGNSYLLLGLRFPYAATVRQRKEGQRGVSLDFVVDTGSTCNVLMPAVASELALPLDSEATPAGWGAQGAIASAPQFVLGDCQLDHLEDKERFTLMTGLKASGLMVPSPGAAGILGRAFLDCFPAVEFQLQVTIKRTSPANQTLNIRLSTCASCIWATFPGNVCRPLFIITHRQPTHHCFL